MDLRQSDCVCLVKSAGRKPDMVKEDYGIGVRLGGFPNLISYIDTRLVSTGRAGDVPPWRCQNHQRDKPSSPCGLRDARRGVDRLRRGQGGLRRSRGPG